MLLRDISASVVEDSCLSHVKFPGGGYEFIGIVSLNVSVPHPVALV